MCCVQGNAACVTVAAVCRHVMHLLYMSKFRSHQAVFVPRRFMKTSGKIFDKMGSNLGQMATTAKQVVDKVGEQIWGKGRDQ